MSRSSRASRRPPCPSWTAARIRIPPSTRPPATRGPSARGSASRSKTAGSNSHQEPALMEGLFTLKTPADLREKMRRDLEKMRAAPLDADAAFNFFVTAEHMLDWVYPRDANRQARTDARKKSTLLQVCSHLANGAKHFEVEGKQHQSVDKTGRSGIFYAPPTYLGRGYFPAGHFGFGPCPPGCFEVGRLIVHLKN